MPDPRHEPDRQRFVLDTEHGEAFLEYRSFSGGIIPAHTEVPEAAEGQGLGSALARAALAHARANDLKVRPTCPFVISYMDRHPEYDDLRR